MPQRELVVWAQEAREKKARDQLKAIEASSFPNMDGRVRVQIVKQYEEELPGKTEDKNSDMEAWNSLMDISPRRRRK